MASEQYSPGPSFERNVNLLSSSRIHFHKNELCLTFCYSEDETVYIKVKGLWS